MTLVRGAVTEIQDFSRSPVARSDGLFCVHALMEESSPAVCERAEAILARAAKEDSVEAWEDAERLFLALVETKAPRHRRREALKKISDRFPDSRRASWLTLLDLEADGLHKSAYEVYSKMGATEALARKRIVAMHKKQGNLDEAIAELCDYLDVFMADAAAWRELAELYVDTKRLDKAVFCSAEVMLAYPQNTDVLCRHAEILVLNNDARMARKYYCLAAEDILRAKEEGPNRHGLARALRGIVECVVNDNDETAVKIGQWAQKKLREMKLE